MDSEMEGGGRSEGMGGGGELEEYGRARSWMALNVHRRILAQCGTAASGVAAKQG